MNTDNMESMGSNDPQFAFEGKPVKKTVRRGSRRKDPSMEDSGEMQAATVDVERQPQETLEDRPKRVFRGRKKREDQEQSVESSEERFSESASSQSVYSSDKDDPWMDEKTPSREYTEPSRESHEQGSHREHEGHEQVREERATTEGSQSAGSAEQPTGEGEGQAQGQGGRQHEFRKHHHPHQHDRRGGFNKFGKPNKFGNKDKKFGKKPGNAQGGNPKRPEGGEGAARKGADGRRWQQQSKERIEGAPVFGDLANWEMWHNPVMLEETLKKITEENKEPLDFHKFYDMGAVELVEHAKSLGLEFEGTPNKTKALTAIMKHAFAENTPSRITGVLQILSNGHGLMLYEKDNYKQKQLCTFVHKNFLKKYGLKYGHIMEVLAHPPREVETCPSAIKIISVMGKAPEDIAQVTSFNDLVPYYPTERIVLETKMDAKWDNFSMRIVDLLAPIGLGQRGLIVAPPRTGKTVLLHAMANAILVNKPNAHLTVLLVDERPEEVTDFRRHVAAEIVASTFDETAESHMHLAEVIMHKSKRMVENGQHVIILLDSITRLARAYNAASPSSGKILSGGVEAGALQWPKRFFGAARNIENGGSLTILGTALIETGSRMDEVIFEEFKGTGNMELHLDRALSDKRIFPAMSMDKSGTRKEELLYHPDELNKIYSLRRAMKGVTPVEAMEMLIQRTKKTRSNAEFLMALQS